MRDAARQGFSCGGTPPFGYVSSEMVRERIERISNVLENGNPQRVRDELRKTIKGIVVFPDGRVTIEVDPEGVLEAERRKFCLGMVPEVGVEPTRGVSPTGF